MAASTKARVLGGIAGALVAVGGLAAGTASAAPATVCSTPWGSLPESDAGSTTAPITGVRAGRHTCFDRLVVDLAGDVDGWDVRYVTQVFEDGSGEPVPLRGGADLAVVVRAPAHDDDYEPTWSPADRREAVRVSGFRTFRQVASAGSFEGQTTIGLGVRARLPFRVFVLDGPGRGSRLVIDVAHRW